MYLFYRWVSEWLNNFKFRTKEPQDVLEVSIEDLAVLRDDVQQVGGDCQSLHACCVPCLPGFLLPSV